MISTGFPSALTDWINVFSFLAGFNFSSTLATRIIPSAVLRISLKFWSQDVVSILAKTFISFALF